MPTIQALADVPVNCATTFEARPAWLRCLFNPPLRYFLQRDIERRLAQLAKHLRSLETDSEEQVSAH